MARGISLHIGLNRIDSAHYGDDGSLIGCHNDAVDMQSIAEHLGYGRCSTLLDEGATAAGVKEELEAAASDLQRDDFFLITYAGYGGGLPKGEHRELSGVLNGGATGRVRTWCLYDRMLSDDELYAAFAQFQEGVRVAILADSCYAGTITRPIDNRVSRRLGQEVPERIYQEHRHDYDDILTLSRSSNRDELRVSAIVITSCMDNQGSWDGSPNGLSPRISRRSGTTAGSEGPSNVFGWI